MRGHPPLSAPRQRVSSSSTCRASAQRSAPDQPRNLRYQLKQLPHGSRVGGHDEFLDRPRPVRNDSVVPAPHFITEESGTPQASPPHRPICDHTAFGGGHTPSGGHLNDVLFALVDDLQRRMEQSNGRPSFTHCYQHLPPVACMNDHMATCSNRQPQEYRLG